ncbi:MAG: NUDIX hydrolase [Acidimicrobiia bacterium]
MGSAEYPVWDGSQWVPISLPVIDGEGFVVPNVAAIIFRDESKRELLLQRRNAPDVTRGLLELPSGGWRAGEDPWQALSREVREETGLELRTAQTASLRYEAHEGRPFVSSRPAAVTVGVEGAYPVLHLAYVCFAAGEPTGPTAEALDPQWYPVDEVRRLLETPARFTGPTFAILSSYFEA